MRGICVVVVYWINVDAISKMIYDGRSQFQVHTDERTHVHSARLSLTVTHPSINRGRRALTSVNELGYVCWWHRILILFSNFGLNTGFSMYKKVTQ
jgi:hypothetical protein